MAKLTIDGNDLIMALELTAGEMQNYVNAETGEVIVIFDGQVNGVTVEDIDEYLDGGNFYEIMPKISGDGFRVMDDFVDSLPAGTSRSKLRKALAGNRPFRRFKDALHDFPNLRDDWHRFEELQQREYLTRMIAGFGLDANITWRQLPEPAPPPQPKSGPIEQVMLEFPWTYQKSAFATCRLTLRKTKKRSTIHIDYFEDDIMVAEGLAIAPDDIDPLIEALTAVKGQL